MSLTIKLVLFAAFISFMLIMANSYRRRKKRIIFFGDSITEQGALFGGYIQKLQTYLQQNDLGNKYELISMGKSGDKVTDLLNRVSKDILERGSEIVVVFVGVNDVLQHYTQGTGTTEEAFRTAYSSLADRLKAAQIKTYLCTPVVIGEQTDSQPGSPDDMLESYCRIIREVAATAALPLIDLRKEFKTWLGENNLANAGYGLLTTDGIHLSDKGNTVVAEALYTALITP